MGEGGLGVRNDHFSNRHTVDEWTSALGAILVSDIGNYETLSE